MEISESTIVDAQTGEILSPAMELAPLPTERHLITALEEIKQGLALIDDPVVIKELRDRAAAIQSYYRQQKYSLDMQNAAAEVKLRAERRLGDLLVEMKENGERDDGRGNNKSEALKFQDGTPKLSDLGINKKQSYRWQQIASIPAPLFERQIESLKQSDEEVTQAAMLAFARGVNNTRNVMSSESNEWYTPASYIEAARQVMGAIDIDPASNDLANETVRASVHFTVDDDGLAKEWRGRVWLNPPYRAGAAGDFCAKLLSEYQAGRVTEAVVLLNAHITETKWFAPLWDHLLCFTNHRINFISPSGNGNGSTHGSVFVYLGPQHNRFAEHFKQFGPVVKKVA